jgi:glycosyltransferase involved in cell wall biosynthesis
MEILGFACCKEKNLVNQPIRLHSGLILSGVERIKLKEKAKILFIYQAPRTFINKDIAILKSDCTVRCVRYRGFWNVASVFRGILWCDVTFSWFCSIHAFFAVFFSKLLGKKSIVVVGGHEVAYEPEIKYGMFSFWWKRWCPKCVFECVNLILSVSNSTSQECLENAKATKAKVKLLYHGFDSNIYKPTAGIKKKAIVITVGTLISSIRRKKGFELFVRSADLLPATEFFLIGPWDNGTINILEKIAPANVTFTGGIYGYDLVKMYSRAKVYVQVSQHESFGCALAEAMLCECIPVVSRKAAIPEVAGDCGFYVDELTPEEVAEKIKEALASPEEFGRRARERIINLFPLEKRKENLLSAVNSL